MTHTRYIVRIFQFLIHSWFRPRPTHESEKWKWSHSVVSDSSRPHGLQPTRLVCPWDFPGKSTGVGCHWAIREAPKCAAGYVIKREECQAPRSMDFGVILLGFRFWTCHLAGGWLQVPFSSSLYFSFLIWNGCTTNSYVLMVSIKALACWSCQWASI